MVRRESPANKLSREEELEILKVCNQREFSSSSPSQIVPKLADQGHYLASESSIYRLLKREGQLSSRDRYIRREPREKKTLIANGPDEVWSWDITYIPRDVKGQFYYLYLIEDLYSRFGVCWEVYDRESGQLASDLVAKAFSNRIETKCLPKLHSDNGSPMRSQTMKYKLKNLGIVPSYSRPGVSNDNAYIESLFKTLKYRSTWPKHGFKSINEARDWVNNFMNWYNFEHMHSKINFVTPFQRYSGKDREMLKKRVQVYEDAKKRKPERWSGGIRCWLPIDQVVLN